MVTNKSQFREAIECLIRKYGSPLQVRKDYWVWNDQYGRIGRRRLKWWGIRIKPEALKKIQQYCSGVDGIEKIYLNKGKGADLCIIVNKSIREIKIRIPA